MISNLVACCVLVIVISSATQAAKQHRPKFVRKCVYTKAEFSKCWRQGLEELRPYLIKGIPEFNAPSIDPMIVPHYTLKQKDDIGIYNLIITDVVYTGAKDFEILDNVFDLESLKFQLKLKISQVIFRCRFEVDGTLIGFKIDGVGLGFGEFNNFTAEISAVGEKHTANGQTFVSWDDGQADISYSNSDVKVKGLFNSPIIERVFNTAVNANADVLYSHITTVLRNTFGQQLLEILNRAHRAYSIEVLYGEK